jgi:aminoglycoside 6'-N-acetyltransferase-1b
LIRYAAQFQLAVTTTDFTITFRPLCGADLPLLHDWIHRPHVVRWWGGGDAGGNLEDTTKKYLPRLQEASSISAYIALLSGDPIGFVQSYVALGCGDGWWEDETDPGVRGIDQFLCDAGKLGQGMGSRMVAAFVRQLFQDPAVTKVQTDPDPTNARAIRCYEKAGFHPVGTVATPDGPALLMVIERHAAEEHASAA